MRIRLIGFENQVGNSRDLAILDVALRGLGHDVEIVRVTRTARRVRRWLADVLAMRVRPRRSSHRDDARLCDLNVMLEHVWPTFLARARCNVIVPNPEWCDRADRRLLPQFDAIWAKTRYAAELFAPFGPPVHYIGFDSFDRYDAGVPRAPRCLHLAGKSRMKGTARLLRAWLAHPDWPALTIVYSRAGVFEPQRGPNIRYQDEFIDDATLRRLQNEHLIHLCLSETEGWGHYIPEALSVGAIVLATDAPPMNELVSAERGLLVASAPLGQQHLSRTFAFDASALGRQLERALAMDPRERQLLQQNARRWFIDNKREFPTRLAAALRQLAIR
ncbi:MAG: hypothetical protein NZM12_06295 [Steroidobacteraceae bacterium]|nr:hypothetical protein [Steroidobacteraceae bacterium]MDW8260555.1 glycosyl transferase family 1 [Gammaproteobacteria bacterium]